MFRRVLAFITNAGARRATQFRLLLWRGKDQKTSSKKKVDRGESRGERRAREEERERAAGGSAAGGRHSTKERDKKKASKKNFQKKLYASKQSITPPHIDLFPHL